MIRFLTSKSLHLSKLLLLLVLIPSTSSALKDKVYFRVESDYYSGWEVRKYQNRIKYFQCLYPESAALEVMTKYYASHSKEKKSLKELIDLKIDNRLKYYEPVGFYLTYFKLTKFLSGHSVVLSQKLLKSVKDQIRLSGCRFNDEYEKDSLEAVKPFYEMEIFLKSRFNLNLAEGKLNYKSAFNFLDSIDGQYRHEFFN